MVRVILDSLIRTDVDLTELPCDTKLSFDPFRNYPEFVTADIPADVALEHRRQIQALATQVSPCAAVADLVTSSRDNHDDGNAGAISLEMFGAKITGDCIVPNTEEVDGRMESRIREFEDGLSADTLFRRDWRETRVVDISEGTSGPSVQRPTNTEASETGKEIVASGYTTKVA